MKRLTSVLCGALLCATGCDNEILPPQLDQPFLYLVLEPGGIWDGLGTFNHYAIATTIVSADEVQCRSVQQISLTSVPDGSPFAIRTDGTCETIHGNPSIPTDACCTIPGSPPPDSLGALDLRHRQSYELEVVTEGTTIRGHTAVPDNFGARVENINGTRTLIWAPVEGAAGYEVILGLTQVIRQTDTSFALDEGFRGTIRLLALDPNLWSYVAGEQVLRAGIDTGFGVFGAISAAPRIEIVDP